MYGIPDDYDTGALLGRELCQVCFNGQNLFLRFIPSMTIQIESCIDVLNASGAWERIDDFDSSPMSFLDAVSCSVVSASRIDERTLELRFSGGQGFRLIDDSEGLESFNIDLDGDLLVV